MTTNNNIRHLREFKGYSQKYIASQLGKSQAEVSKIENGQIHLSDHTIEQLCKILEITKDEIFEDENILGKPLKRIIGDLFNQLSENKKLLRDVEINQGKLQRQLNQLISRLIKKSS